MIPISPSCTEALSQITNAARYISGRCLAHTNYRVTPDAHSLDLPLPPIKLSPVKDITPQLAGLGAPTELLCRISTVYRQHATQLRECTEQQIQQAWKQLSDLKTPPTLLQKAIDGFVELYERQLGQWESSAIARVRSLSDASKNSKEDHTRRRFNNDYLPYLEHYFEENAFPSHRDKVEMAKKSSMSYRQIDVWFQNRRSRAKREGKSLKRRLAHERPRVSSKGLESLTGDRVIPEHERASSVDSDISEYEWQYDSDGDSMSSWTAKCSNSSDACDLFGTEVPTHAFPAAYRPRECEAQPKFVPPVWMRRPATVVERKPAIDFDEFVAQFAKLSVMDGPRKRLVKKTPEDRNRGKRKRTQPPPSKPGRSAATLFITTKQLPAPLPALIRSAVCAPRSPLTAHLSTFTASHTTSTAAVTPSLAQTIPGAESVKRRKISPLPKRSPTGSDTPSNTSGSSPPSLPSSRTSSFSSDHSPHSSGSSSASSAVATPTGSPTSLPVQLSSIPDYHYVQDVNDPLTRSISIERFSFDFYSDTGKGTNPFVPLANVTQLRTG